MQFCKCFKLSHPKQVAYVHIKTGKRPTLYIPQTYKFVLPQTLNIEKKIHALVRSNRGSPTVAINIYGHNYYAKFDNSGVDFDQVVSPF